jgi:hypothetical protein
VARSGPSIPAPPGREMRRSTTREEFGKALEEAPEGAGEHEGECMRSCADAIRPVTARP